MEKIEGMLEAFKESKQVFLTTNTKEGEKSIRAMTNYNESPYDPMWYPSFKDTQKIRDISENPEVLISFPSKEENKWFRVRGKASLAPWDEVRKSWKWWYLEWVPEKNRNKFELRYDNPFTDRSIIWIDPESAKIVDSK
jgi:general stress protein 26